MSVVRVTVRSNVTTRCPDGGTDQNEVAVSWTRNEFFPAQAIHDICASFAGQELYCERLANDVAKRAAQALRCAVEVRVRQRAGHGVEVEAIG